MSGTQSAATTHWVVRVRIESGPHVGKSFEWDRPGSYLVGRAAHADLSLPLDIVASLEHCRIEMSAEGCQVRDLSGRKGTLLNGQVVTQSQLRSGDRLQIGLSHLRVDVGREARSASNSSGDAPTATLAQPPPGQRAPVARGLLDIPGYSITRKLGAGGMGVVYEATAQTDGRRVALKTLIPAAGTAPRAIALFRRELSVLAQLRHPHIVPYVDSGEHAGQVYLVMELVETIDFEALLRGLPPPRQVAVSCLATCQVLDALAYAHARKLVHRDIKPRNILIAREGPRITAKLADFGLAKNFEQAGLSQLTADDEVRGTPAFMPWEQLQNSRFAKPTVDLYATAATLYYWLTGQPPARSAQPRKSWSSVTSLFRPKRPAEALPPTAMRQRAETAGVPPSLAAVLDQALAADPRQRYATAVTMRAALEPFASGPPQPG